MRRVLAADKDAYITDKIVAGRRSFDANVGAAGSLDLFKLYDETISGSSLNIELSRLLVHFDLDPLRRLVASHRIDPGESSFACTLRLADVYGGQPTPANFDVEVHPLSASFDEGLGRDVAFYGDSDICNFITGSRAGGAWYMSGAGLGGHVTGAVDFITTATLGGMSTSLGVTQHFIDGSEDLAVDVTTIVSATLAGILPDSGFRIALTSAHENDDRTYFVKRFASRAAYDPSKRPMLIVRYDDSLQDDVAALEFDSACDVFLRNRSRGRLSDIIDNGVHVTGSNCLRLRMTTEVSGGWYSVPFMGSQRQNGIFAMTGVYTSSVLLDSSDAIFKAKIASSGSVVFRPIWESIAGTVAYLTGSDVSVAPPDRSTFGPGAQRLIVTVSGIGPELPHDRTAIARINIFDAEKIGARHVKSPIIPPDIVMRDVHAQIRDSITGQIIVPFDTTGNSSRVSSDARGHYFELDGASLPPGRSYVVDIMLAVDETTNVYRSASPEFNVPTAQ